MRDKPYDTGSLACYCVKQFQCSKSMFLDALQTLFDKRLVTYPRTDCRYITTAIKENLEQNGVTVPDEWVDDKTVRDHTAIVPTFRKVRRAALSPLEWNVYSAIYEQTVGHSVPEEIAEEKETPQHTSITGNPVHDKMLTEDPLFYFFLAGRSV